MKTDIFPQVFYDEQQSAHGLASFLQEWLLVRFLQKELLEIEIEAKKEQTAYYQKFEDNAQKMY